MKLELKKNLPSQRMMLLKMAKILGFISLKKFLQVLIFYYISTNILELKESSLAEPLFNSLPTDQFKVVLAKYGELIRPTRILSPMDCKTINDQTAAYFFLEFQLTLTLLWSKARKLTLD